MRERGCVRVYTHDIRIGTNKKKLVIPLFIKTRIIVVTGRFNFGPTTTR